MLSTNFAFLAEKHPEWFEYASLAEEYLWNDPQSAGGKIRSLLEIILNSVYANVGLDPTNTFGILEKVDHLGSMVVMPPRITSTFHDVRMIGNAALHPKAGEAFTVSMARQGLQGLHTAIVWYYRTYIDKDFPVPEFQPYVYSSAQTAGSSEAPTMKKDQENSAPTVVPPSRAQQEPVAVAKPIAPEVTYVDLKEENTPDNEDSEVKPNRNDWGFSAGKPVLNDAELDIYRILADARRMAATRTQLVAFQKAA